jgi:hypothetical protein
VSANHGTGNNVLFGASCVSAKSCTAVGFSGDGAAPLIESSSGGAWKVVPSPTLGGAYDMLRGVSCTSTKFCVAVGWGEVTGTSGSHRTLIDAWNGTTWARVPSANLGTPDNDLTAVSCLSPTWCVAVGTRQASATGDTLPIAEWWDGTTWTFDKTVPSVPAKVGTKLNGVEDSIAGVSCPTAHSCTAVGSYQDTRGFSRTMIISWNGTAWSTVKSPNDGLSGNVLAGVSCVSPKVCDAVGTYGGGKNGDPGKPHTMAESWNGTAWSQVASPNPGAAADALTGISCAGAKSCQAVGFSQASAGGARHTLIESWNGSRWKAIPSPNPTAGTKTDTYYLATGSGLNGISCASSTSCRVVGFQISTGGVDRTLVEKSG